ncbi:MAG TPA: hypothetical protein VD931_07730 [Baekduia sp.]|nr:hypothetical protein [Baekduia sp.]
MDRDRRRKRGLHLTRRDQRILEDLTVRRAETLGWLHCRHFAGLSRKRALNRLGDLVAHGYLTRTRVVQPWDGEEVSAYTFGPRAKAAIVRRSLAGEHFLHRRWNPMLREQSIPHQLAVNRVGDWLGADLIPEHLLEAKDRQAVRHRPDATYQLAEFYDPVSSDDGLAYLEVDLGHYSRRRLVGKARTFAAAQGSARLLIVCPTVRRADTVRAWLDHDLPYLRHPRLTVLTLRQVRELHPPHLRPAPAREHFAIPDLPEPETEPNS